jgi:uncharacterized protein YbjQ (UPF0145 family)
MEQSAPNALGQVRENPILRLEISGIPEVAEQRLRALRGSASALFTSTLSVDEFAFTKATGLRPVSQVMGACVFQLATPGWYKRIDSGHTRRVDRDGWNTPRDSALHRMSLEAQACGAQVVTGVRIKRNDLALHGLPAPAHEFVATGTAMVREGAGPAAQGGQDTVMTSLSAQDHWKLVRHGFHALGLVACTICVGRQPSAATMKALNFADLTAAGRENREAPEFSALVTDAYSTAMTELRAQASRLGAAGIVGVQIDRSQYQDECFNRIVMVDAIGTAITARRSADSGSVKAAPPIVPVRRLDRERSQSR